MKVSEAVLGPKQSNREKQNSTQFEIRHHPEAQTGVTGILNS